MREQLLKEAEQRLGQILKGKWRLDKLIDIGGTAAVYAATHRNGSQVAIKILHELYASHDDTKQRFLEEGYVANKVKHPAVVSIIDDDQLDDGTAFLVMELLEGRSLEDHLKANKTLAVAPVLFIVDSVLGVLGKAHEAGIIHRDIKPPNIYLTSEGQIKVLDFGLARVKERSLKGGALTQTGMVVGTAAYMPPEQARGRREQIDARTDIWAVGATMFKALTGDFVHGGSTMNERLIKAMTERPRLIRDVSPNLPDLVADIVDRALAYEKADRFPDAPSMQQAVTDAYEALENCPMPSLQRPSGIWQAGLGGPETGPGNLEPSMLAISVLFDPSPGDSVLVEIDDMEGHKQQYELRESTTRTVGEAPTGESSPGTATSEPGDRSGVLPTDSALGSATVIPATVTPAKKP